MGSGSSRRRGAAAAVPAAVPVGRAPGHRELLQTALAEGEEAAALPAPGRRAPAAAGTPPARDGGRCGGALLQQAALSTRNPTSPESSNADHQCPQESSKKPVGQSTISYDYSEEELMASIEREYCR